MKTWRCTLLIIALVLHGGCFTARTLARAKPYNCKYATITRITKAAITNTDIFIEFQARARGADGGEDRVLRIPLNTSAWLHDRRGKPVFPSEYRIDQTQVQEVSEWFLLPKSVIPADGKDLPITSVGIDLSRLPEKAADVSENL